MIQDAGTAFNKLRPYPSFQRGLESGGSLLVQSALVLGRYGSAVSEAPLVPEAEIDVAEEQELLLKNLAQGDGCWFPNANSYLVSLGYRFYGYGGEAQVYAERRVCCNYASTLLPSSAHNGRRRNLFVHEVPWVSQTNRGSPAIFRVPLPKDHAQPVHEERQI